MPAVFTLCGPRKFYNKSITIIIAITIVIVVIFVIVNTAAFLIPLIIIIQSLRTAASSSVQLRRGCRVPLDARLCSAGCIYT